MVHFYEWFRWRHNVAKHRKLKVTKPDGAEFYFTVYLFLESSREREKAQTRGILFVFVEFQSWFRFRCMNMMMNMQWNSRTIGSVLQYEITQEEAFY